MFISLSLALLALAAGMLLLAKTNKEDLGKSFKFISYFIIVCSFVIMALTLVRGFTKMILRRSHPQEHGFYQRRHRMHHRFFHHENGYRKMEGWNEEGPEREYGWEGREAEHGFSQHGWGRHHDGRMEGTPEEHEERMVKHLSEKLSLNADQVHKLQEIIKSSMQKENEIRSRTEGNHDEFRKLSRENRESRSEAIRKILTPEQLKVFNERNTGMEAREGDKNTKNIN